MLVLAFILLLVSILTLVVGHFVMFNSFAGEFDYIKFAVVSIICQIIAIVILVMKISEGVKIVVS